VSFETSALVVTWVALLLLAFVVAGLVRQVHALSSGAGARPARTGLWEYLFFVDLAGHRDDPKLSAALAELADKAPFLKLLGSYPAALD